MLLSGRKKPSIVIDHVDRMYARIAPRGDERAGRVGADIKTEPAATIGAGPWLRFRGEENGKAHSARSGAHVAHSPVEPGPVARSYIAE